LTTESQRDWAGDPGYVCHEAERRQHWDKMARHLDRWSGLGGTYHRRLAQVFGFLVPPGLRVLELGCGRGDLLAGLNPAIGVGVDFSHEMVLRARARHPSLRFVEADTHELDLDETFDVILLSDLVNDLWDVQSVLERLAPLVHPATRIILNSYSRLWEVPLAVAEGLGLAKATLWQNWLTVQDLSGLLELAGFEVVRHWHEILGPLPIPLFEPLFNRMVVRIWPFSELGLTNFVVARPKPLPNPNEPEPRVTVVVPVRNEAGNIEAVLERTPELGAGTQLIFVEGHSDDDSLAAIERGMQRHPERCSLLLQQTGIGKGDAVRAGFAQATGDILMILDADLTVTPEDLPRFYDILRSGRGEFVNGVRLVYPIEGEAMRLMNLIGNKLFSWAFSWLLGQPVKDTLCGTKALWKKDYEAIALHRPYFGDFDPFGDFDLLFGAAKLNLKIVDMPVRYRTRTYGETNIQRWRHGWLLLKMAALAAYRLKFV
jgi:SAM-dependent methyltransferase